MDCSLVANECIDERLEFGKTWVICEIGLEKAYDYVNWHFLDVFFKRRTFASNGEIR